MLLKGRYCFEIYNIYGNLALGWRGIYGNSARDARVSRNTVLGIIVIER
jgi:hypothetical protein